jgi:hypothetical protein
MPESNPVKRMGGVVAISLASFSEKPGDGAGTATRNGRGGYGVGLLGR